jgi:hypothetical protein
VIREKSLRFKPRGVRSSLDVRGGSQTIVSQDAIAGHSCDGSPSQQLCPTGCDWQHTSGQGLAGCDPAQAAGDDANSTAITAKAANNRALELVWRRFMTGISKSIQKIRAKKSLL